MQERPVPEIFSQWTEEIMSSLTENSPLGIALFSVDGGLIYANSTMNSLFRGDPCDSLINPDYEKLTRLKTNKSEIYSGYMTIGNNSSDNISIMSRVYRKKDQLLITGAVDSKDLIRHNKAMNQLNYEINNLHRQLIKEKYAMEDVLKKLNVANNKLHELNATKDKLFSVIAHDLKNPFNILLGFSDLLHKNAHKYPAHKIEEYAQTMYNASEQAHKLLENLLKWSSAQTGRLNPAPEKLIPADIVDEIKLLHEPMAATKNIAIKSDINYSHTIFTDREMLKTILNNLVGNAIKFTYTGGVITIKSQCHENSVLFIVSDTGTGIEQVHIKNLFRADSKLSKAGTTNEKGTGLGLILCKEFVEKLKGKIWAESEPGKGSDFKFTIPAHN